MAKHHKTSHHTKISELEKQFQEDIDSIGPLMKFYDDMKEAKISEQNFREQYRLNTLTTNKENE